jgi:parallel beta-helix repeat protein
MPMSGKVKRLLASLTLGVGYALALLLLLTLATTGSTGSDTVYAATGSVYCVTPEGGAYADCDRVFTTVQAAVDAATGGEAIRVAAGTYTDLHTAEVAGQTITQVVYIEKDLILRGGYTTTNWTTPYPVTQPTTLNARGQGRVFYAAGNVSVTLEGLRFTGGDATGLGGAASGADAGGGVYVVTATLSVRDSQVLSNTAAITRGHGGGLYVLYSDSPVLENNVIQHNRAIEGEGGGVYFYGCPRVTLTGNTIGDNRTNVWRQQGWGHAGGGARFVNCPEAIVSQNHVHDNIAIDGAGLSFTNSPTAMLTYNQIISNVGAHMWWGMQGSGGVYLLGSDDATLVGNIISGNMTINWCGGVCISGSDNVVLRDNDIIYNVKIWGYDGWGAGAYINNSRNIALIGNRINHNVNPDITRLGKVEGGGLYITGNSDVTLTSNTIRMNGAHRGGGLYCTPGSTVTLISNWIVGNTVYDVPPQLNVVGDGGGIYLRSCSASLINNVLADNQVYGLGHGSGLYALGSSAQLLHTTLASNRGGDGSGVYITGTGSTVALTNTILVSHTVGITAAAGNTATLEATLWGTDPWANLADWGGTGTILTGTINLWDDPAFVDPDAGDYHIRLDSAAIDRGVYADVDRDIDGEPRPIGGYDLGADEVGARRYFPLVFRHCPASSTYASHNLSGHSVAAECNPGGGTNCPCSDEDVSIASYDCYGEVTSNVRGIHTYVNAIGYQKVRRDFSKRRCH